VRPTAILSVLGLVGSSAFILAESLPPASLFSPSTTIEFPFPAYDWRPAVLGPPTLNVDLLADPLAEYFRDLPPGPSDMTVCVPAGQLGVHRAADDTECALEVRGMRDTKLAFQSRPWPHQAHLVDHEITYQLADADEVTIGWTINGWHLPPASSRPPGTREHKGLLYTPMIRRGDVFQVVLPLPRGTLVNFCFRITRTVRGDEIDVWDTNGPRWYVSVAGGGGFATVIGNVNLARHGLGGVPNAPLLDQDIRYRAPEAGEVFLVWGLDGWQIARGELRPAGTVIRKKLMHSPMSNQNGIHSIRVQVPAGMTMEYGFLITKTRDGAPANVWDGAIEYQSKPLKSRTIELASRVTVGVPVP
jgi:hypothetical protein